MRVDIWSSVVESVRVAPPVTVTVKAIEAVGAPLLDPNIKWTEPSFVETISRAHKATCRHFGWPKNVGFIIGIRSIDPDALPLPPLMGNSHYGALAMALAQAVALSEPECIKTGSATPVHILRSVFLQSVAVETACDDNNPNEDSFTSVGKLPQKLAGFCLHGIESPPAICLVSPGQQLFPPNRQDISERFDVSKGQEKYVPRNGRPPLPIYRVDHVHEAFRLLWHAQIRALGRYV